MEFFFEIKILFYTFELVCEVLLLDFRFSPFATSPSGKSKQCEQFGQLIFFPVFAVFVSKKLEINSNQSTVKILPGLVFFDATDCFGGNSVITDEIIVVSG